MRKTDPFKYYKSSPEIIKLAIMLYSAPKLSEVGLYCLRNAPLLESYSALVLKNLPEYVLDKRKMKPLRALFFFKLI